METMNVNKQNDFTTYPTKRVCAIIDNDEDARNALDELLKNNTAEDHIEIFYGTGGIEALDAEAEHHGVGAKIAKKIRAYGDMENETLHIYETAMQNGSYIFEVLADDEKEKESIHRVLAMNKARQINYFGSWHIDALREE
jgi:hypothetical protein